MADQPYLSFFGSQVLQAMASLAPGVLQTLLIRQLLPLTVQPVALTEASHSAHPPLCLSPFL